MPRRPTTAISALLACAALTAAGVLGDCPAAAFPPLCVTVDESGPAPAGAFLDLERIFCPAHLAGDGGCSAGVHNHSRLALGTAVQCIDRPVYAVDDSGAVVPLYVVFASVNTGGGGGGSGDDAPRFTCGVPRSSSAWQLLTPDVLKAALSIDWAAGVCTITQMSPAFKPQQSG
jgi:hypothetical protein